MRGIRPYFFHSKNVLPDSNNFYKFRYDLVINKTGKITEVKSYNENSRTDSLMIKHILKMPKWSPAIKDGKKASII